MKLATIRISNNANASDAAGPGSAAGSGSAAGAGAGAGTGAGAGARTVAVRVDGDELVELGQPDVGAVLAQPGWRELAEQASGTRHPLEGADFAPLVPNPSKVLCVGLNYRTHIQEMGRDLPEYPTLFCKFADTLIGAHDEIQRPVETDEFDWEVELAVVIGAPARRVSGADAEAAIAGFTVLNDITCRDWQFRTREWLQGKNWDSTTPVGPFLVTPDELPGGVRPAVGVTCTVDGQVMQQDNTGDLLFDPVHLVEYSSTMVRLNPGDIIATGTPGGVGHARKPAVYLTAGQTVVTEVEGVGRLENVVVSDESSSVASEGDGSTSGAGESDGSTSGAPGGDGPEVG